MILASLSATIPPIIADADTALLTLSAARLSDDRETAHQHGLLHIEHGAVELDQVPIVGDGLQQANLLRACMQGRQRSALSGACDKTAPTCPDLRRMAWMSRSTLSLNGKSDLSGIIVSAQPGLSDSLHSAPITWCHRLQQ